MNTVDYEHLSDAEIAVELFGWIQSAGVDTGYAVEEAGENGFGVYVDAFTFGKDDEIIELFWSRLGFLSLVSGTDYDR